MIQSKSFIVTGTTGTRFGKKETTLANDVSAQLNPVLAQIGEAVVAVNVSPLGSVLPDSVLVTVLYHAEEKKAGKK